MNRPGVYLDMDGVVADFVTGAMRVLGRGETKYDGGLDMPGHLGVSPDLFRSRINDEGDRFWSNLPEYPWTKELIRFVQKECQLLDWDFYFVSDPSHFHGCLAGKRDFLLNHGITHDRLILTGQKHLLARPNRLLIDDTPGIVDAWKNHGGPAMLFPACHNHLKTSVSGGIDMVKGALCAHKLIIRWSDRWSGR